MKRHRDDELRGEDNESKRRKLNPFTILPLDVIPNILIYLQCEVVCQTVSLVCTEWKNLLSRDIPYYWKRMCQAHHYVQRRLFDEWHSENNSERRREYMVPVCELPHIVVHGIKFFKVTMFREEMHRRFEELTKRIDQEPDGWFRLFHEERRKMVALKEELPEPYLTTFKRLSVTNIYKHMRSFFYSFVNWRTQTPDIVEPVTLVDHMQSLYEERPNKEYDQFNDLDSGTHSSWLRLAECGSDRRQRYHFFVNLDQDDPCYGQVAVTLIRTHGVFGGYLDIDLYNALKKHIIR